MTFATGASRSSKRAETSSVPSPGLARTATPANGRIEYPLEPRSSAPISRLAHQAQSQLRVEDGGGASTDKGTVTMEKRPKRVNSVWVWGPPDTPTAT